MTLNYYNSNADGYRQRTAEVRNLDHLYEQFLPLLPQRAHILDAGCGPGRDTRAFLQRGYRVTAMDGSQAMVDLAEKFTGQRPLLLEFQQIDFTETFDGIWAYASLLHVPGGQIDDVLRRLTRALKTGGIFFATFKAGVGERTTKEGRYFQDYTEATLRSLLARHPSLGVILCHESPPNPVQCEAYPWMQVMAKKLPG